MDLTDVTVGIYIDIWVQCFHFQHCSSKPGNTNYNYTPNPHITDVDPTPIKY